MYAFCFQNLLTALAQMVACLPLVQQVWGSIPGGVVNFHLKIFNLWARGGGGDVHFLIARLYITCLDYIQNPSAVCMLRRHIILLIAIRLSDGDVKHRSLLGTFREEQAMNQTRFHLLPSFHHHPTQHNYTTQTVTLAVTLTSTFSSTLYRYSSHTQCGLPKRCVIRK